MKFGNTVDNPATVIGDARQVEEMGSTSSAATTLSLATKAQREGFGAMQHARRSGELRLPVEVDLGELRRQNGERSFHL